MPHYGNDSWDRTKQWAEARRQVRTKFPNLMEGSTGWGRAVQNRFNRLKMHC